MKTRMELWEGYRNEINNNINLQKSVKHSNETLKILYKRLLDAFPTYEEKYKVEHISVNANTEQLSHTPTISNKQVAQLLNAITSNNLEINFKGIENIDFSSHDLDDVLEHIKQHRTVRSSVDVNDKNTETFMKETKSIDLEMPNKSEVQKMSTKINVAIDGPSGCGKSTIAKLLAQKYDLIYINTGLVYRAIALHIIDNHVDISDTHAVINALSDIKIKLLNNEEVKLNDKFVTKKLREDIISQSASKISVIQEVRNMAVKIQQKAAGATNSIMEGRDTTFRVMPNANVKIYLDTKPEIRAQRRVDQNKELGFNTDYNEILQEIRERDKRDIERDVDPLHQVDDAIYIDASEMTINDVEAAISKIIDKL